MDYNRANEILHSNETFEVLYNNQPVWINHLDQNKKVAEVVNSDKKNMEVPLNELVEGKKLE